MARRRRWAERLALVAEHDRVFGLLTGEVGRRAASAALDAAEAAEISVDGAGFAPVAAVAAALSQAQ